MADAGAIVAVGVVEPTRTTPQAAVVDTQTRQIGLIIPPPDIRAIVDKTAEFVAKNGALRCQEGACAGLAASGGSAALWRHSL